MSLFRGETNIQEVEIYFRNSKKKATIVKVPKEISGLAFSKLAAEKMRLHEGKFVLVFHGKQLNNEQNICLSQKSIVHIIDLDNIHSECINLNIRPLNPQFPPQRYSVSSTKVIQQFIHQKLVDHGLNNQRDVILIYTGRQLNGSKSFEQELVQNQSEIFLVDRSRFKTRKDVQPAFKLGVFSEKPVELKSGNIDIKHKSEEKIHSNIKYRVVIFQAPGGKDKDKDGHRKDSIPIAQAINELPGYHCDIVFYTDENQHSLYQECKDKYSAYVPRVNPGTIAGGEENFFAFLRKLSNHGVIGMPHPDIMIDFGSKEILFKLAGTALVPADTLRYFNIQELKENLPTTITFGERVLKQNRGTVGQGIWRITPTDPSKFIRGVPVPLNTPIICTQAINNHQEQHKISSFINLCQKKYFSQPNNFLIDMRFLPRVVQGQISVLSVGKVPKMIVRKVPKKAQKGGNAFSATMFSGATYTYHQPEEFPEIINVFYESVKIMMERLGTTTTPLIWTSDFLLETGVDRKDEYILNEINCSCVGFITNLNCGIQQEIAQQIKRTIETASGIHGII